VLQKALCRRKNTALCLRVSACPAGDLVSLSQGRKMSAALVGTMHEPTEAKGRFSRFNPVEEWGDSFLERRL
jgi:hypothetical protein